MEKRKMLNWLKKRKQPDTESSIVNNEKQGPELKQTKEEMLEKPIKEYNEILHSKGSNQKQTTKISPEKKQSVTRTSWENAEIVEENIDKLHRKHSESTDRGTQRKENTDKKVDYILLKKKR